MRFDDLPQARESFLSSYTFPQLTFTPSGVLPKVLKPIWELLAQRKYTPACERALESLAVSDSASAEERAALYLALAAGSFGIGNRKRASTAAEESIKILPGQWAAHRMVVQLFWAEGDYENAYFYLSTLLDPGTSHVWDEPLTQNERHVAIAAVAWRLKDWDGVYDHLMRTFDAGKDMPVPLKEDAFRVAVYCERSDDAASMAESLLDDYRIEEIDMMLRTLDARGWSEQALALYRKAYARHEQNELLRRRLVGLCIRLGHVDEARTLTEGNALDLAA